VVDIHTWQNHYEDGMINGYALSIEMEPVRKKNEMITEYT
jgi:hypothetical protein